MFFNHNVSRDGSSLVIRWNLLCWVWSIELSSIEEWGGEGSRLIGRLGRLDRLPICPEPSPPHSFSLIGPFPQPSLPPTLYKSFCYQHCHFSPEDGDNMFLRNVGIYRRKLRRTKSSSFLNMYRNSVIEPETHFLLHVSDKRNRIQGYARALRHKGMSYQLRSFCRCIRNPVL
jgi:hypothetical protein